MKNVFFSLPILAAGLALSFSSCTQTISGEGEPIRQERHVSGFKEVTFSLPGSLEISQGASFGLTVLAQPNLQDAIQTEVRGDELIIESDKNIRSSQPLRFILTMPSIEGVELDGSGSVVVRDMFEPERFELELSGSGNFNGQFSAREVNSEINGSGDIVLSGRAERHHAQINGSGNIRASKLETKESKITINGSGDADVTVLERLDVQINGSGDVTYRGNPQTQNTSVNGSGRVNRR